jgi:hypothetical protein
MIDIDKLVDRLYANAEAVMEGMRKGRISAAAQALTAVSAAAKTITTHPDIDRMSVVSRSKLAVVGEFGDWLTAQAARLGLVH